MTFAEAARAFLGHHRIAVTGVSRNGDTAASTIYRKMKESGRQVVPVNPLALDIDGDPCYPTIRDIPGGVEAVVIGSPPGSAVDVVRDAAASGASWVWLHRSFGQGSFSDEAVRTARELGMDIIPGGCPMMFLEPVDPAHRCFRWWFGRKVHPVTPRQAA